MTVRLLFADLPPPYTTKGRDNPTPPPCTCPRREHHPAQAAVQDAAGGNDEESSGPSIGKVVAGAALIGVAAPVLAVAGAAVVLPAIGFGTGGVVGGTCLDLYISSIPMHSWTHAGSIAATVQSIFYGGATGGLFSLFQSAGATIAAPALSSVVTAAGSAVYGGKLMASGATGDSTHSNPESESESDSDGAQDGAKEGRSSAVCQCTACICPEDCDCDCRRRRRVR